jgi:hypothetical protein
MSRKALPDRPSPRVSTGGTGLLALLLLACGRLGAGDSDCPRCELCDPALLEAEYRLGDGSASPGGTLAVPFSILSNELVDGVKISVDFDEEVLEAVGADKVYTRPDGEDYSFWIFETENSNETPGDGGIDEGYLISAFVFDFIGCNNLPSNEVTETLRLTFRVKPDAPVGVTEIRFLDGGASTSTGFVVENLIVAWGLDVLPEMTHSFVFIDGRVNVLPDGNLFIRGDSNQDGKVDISDPIATLGSLFLGSEQLSCPDAADADDNGEVDISDAVRTLQFLFHGTGPLPPPNGEPGEDPTADTLQCLSAS